MKRSSRKAAGFFVALIPLLVLWFTRLWALDLLPLHNDEGLHLTRAVEVWNGHPFWAISDGKIINHWLIAGFSPQYNPVFAGRVATVFVAMLGLSAGFVLARRLAGGAGAALASALWIGTPYLFFYERLAFSDAEAGALVVVAVWLAVRAVELRRMRLAILSGVFFGLSALFKFTAAPYALALILIFWLYPAGDLSGRVRLRYGVAAMLTAGAEFVIPLGYLALRGDDFFSIALGWIGGSSGGQPAFFANMTRLAQQFTGFGAVGWAILALLGVLVLADQSRRRRESLAIVLSALIPLLIILLLGREALSRHFVVTLPLLLTAAGAGLGMALRRVRDTASRQMVTGFGVAALAFGAAPVFLTAYSDPASVTLPDDVRYEHITSHSAGYALREALQDLPLTLVRRDLPVIASMFPDSCRRANFYAVNNLRLTCTDAPGREQIEAALNEYGAVYVLVERAPLIGLDMSTLDAQLTRLGVYPRPGETEANASVILWLVEKTM